jgi:hypothetical protein
MTRFSLGFTPREKPQNDEVFLGGGLREMKKMA